MNYVWLCWRLIVIGWQRCLKWKTWGACFTLSVDVMILFSSEWFGCSINNWSERFSKELRPLHTEYEMFACVFPFFRIPHPFLSKCMQRMRKRRKSNLIQKCFDGRKFWRQCANVIDTTWGRIYFLTCENFGFWKFCRDL